MPVTLNESHRLYVIPFGNGYSCLGFDVAKARATATANWLGIAGPVAPEGTIEAYNEYEWFMSQGALRHSATGERDPSGLSRQLVGLEGKRVEVETTYGERRRFWVGKSTGWRPCHLEIKSRASSGGEAAHAEYKSVKVVDYGPR